MTSSEPAGPATVAEYLQSLPPERREVVAEVRDALAAAMPAGYREAIGFG